MLKKLIKRVFGYFPTKLPVGMTEFDKWVDDFIATYPLPTNNRSDVAYVVATEIVNFSRGTVKKPKQFFYLVIVGGAAKQIAGANMQKIRQKLKEDQEKAAQLEATKKAEDEAKVVNEPPGSLL